jgi:hypothetical protein
MTHTVNVAYVNLLLRTLTFYRQMTVLRSFGLSLTSDHRTQHYAPQNLNLSGFFLDILPGHP